MEAKNISPLRILWIAFWCIGYTRWCVSTFCSILWIL